MSQHRVLIITRNFLLLVSRMEQINYNHMVDGIKLHD